MKIEDVKVEDFDKVYNVNLRGSFNIAKHCIRAMKPNTYGRILLIASIAGKEGNAVSVGGGGGGVFLYGRAGRAQTSVHSPSCSPLMFFFFITKGMTAYSSSKAGVIGLTKAVGKEYAETGITVNALAPAVIRTGASGGGHRPLLPTLVSPPPHAISSPPTPQQWSRACPSTRSST